VPRGRTNKHHLFNSSRHIYPFRVTEPSLRPSILPSIIGIVKGVS
jgi:hypothetical protein